MAHLFTGSALLLTALILSIIDRFYPYVDFMSGFSEKSFKWLVRGLTIVGGLLLSFGIYSYVTYEPPFMRIAVEGDNYFVDGDIGEAGYLQKDTDLFLAGEKSIVMILLWEEVNDGEIAFELNGKGERTIHLEEMRRLKDSFASKVIEKTEAKALYELPIAFPKDGDWILTVKNGDSNIGKFTINVLP